MAENVKFVISIPMADLRDLAESEGLGETPDAEQLTQALREVILAGLEEYLGEAPPIDVKLID